MAEYTQNLNLEKPVGGENFRRQVINGNMDKIDEAVGARVSQSEFDAHKADNAAHGIGTISSNINNKRINDMKTVSMGGMI